MPVPPTERNFEAIIERVLVDQNRCVKRSPDDYDRKLCLDPKLVRRFIQTTQPDTWVRYTSQYPTGAAERLTKRLARQIERKGTQLLATTGLPNGDTVWVVHRVHEMTQGILDSIGWMHARLAESPPDLFSGSIDEIRTSDTIAIGGEQANGSRYYLEIAADSLLGGVSAPRW